MSWIKTDINKCKCGQKQKEKFQQLWKIILQHIQTCAQTPPQENILDDREIASSSACIENCENLMVPIMTEPDDQIPEAYIDILQKHSRDIATCTLPFKKMYGDLPNTISSSLWTCFPFQTIMNDPNPTFFWEWQASFARMLS